MSDKAIICVDDDETILSSLGQQLKRHFGHDYEIELINNGMEVINIYEELIAKGLEIPVIISDQNISPLSGDQILVKLHQLYPKTLKILLTGQADGDKVGNLVNVGALYHYIPKPWDETDLILTVKEALRSYEQEEQLAQQNKLLIETNAELAQSLSLLMATLEATADGILVLDNNGNVVRFNQKFLNLWSISEDINSIKDKNQILELACRQVLQSDICCFQQSKTLSKQNNNQLIELKNNKILECCIQIQQINQENVGSVWSFSDITEREKRENIIKHQAFHDSLTGLANRSYFNLQLKKSLIEVHNSEEMLAVIFFDLDHFKKINDTLGHDTGDILLKKLVQRLNNCIRDNDLISRWGGDEFTLLLPKISCRQDATTIANRILNSLQSAFKIKNHYLRVTCSIGIAVYPDDGEDGETLLKNADIALYQAKYRGRNNYQHYNHNFNSQAHQRLDIENKLYSALENQEFVLYYQPIIDIITGKIVKMEALLRWQRPDVGLIGPNIFIPLAEENGQIVAIGEWVLETACTQNQLWHSMGMKSLSVSVNLSARQFQQQDIVSRVNDILNKTNLPSSALELEITETVTIENKDIAKTILGQFHHMGISLAMDDFGTGYSSLSYLKEFSFDTIKIDRFFVKNVLDSPEDTAILKAIVSLGQGLNVKVVAEGVETLEITDFLKNLQCQYMQGYYFSRPLPAHEATSLLQKNFSL